MSMFRLMAGRNMSADFDKYTLQGTIDPIHAAAMTDKKRGLGCSFTANVHVST